MAIVYLPQILASVLLEMEHTMRLTNYWRRLKLGLQLYNEDINDLLAMENSKLQIHESKEAGVYVAGLREEIVTGADHVLELLSTGEAARHIGETKMNKASSRSHTVFRMVSIPLQQAESFLASLDTYSDILEE